MERTKAIEAYRRAKNWADRASGRLFREMREAGACDPVPLTLHNWGRMGGQEPYRTLDRVFRGRQRRIWDISHRLERAFARYF